MAEAAVSFAKGAFHEGVQCHVAYITEDVKALIFTSLSLPLVLESRKREEVMWEGVGLPGQGSR